MGAIRRSLQLKTLFASVRNPFVTDVMMTFKTKTHPVTVIWTHSQGKRQTPNPDESAVRKTNQCNSRTIAPHSHPLLRTIRPPWTRSCRSWKRCKTTSSISRVPCHPRRLNRRPLPHPSPPLTTANVKATMRNMIPTQRSSAMTIQIATVMMNLKILISPKHLLAAW